MRIMLSIIILSTLPLGELAYFSTNLLFYFLPITMRFKLF